MVREREVQRLLGLDRSDIVSVSLDVDPRRPEHRAAKPGYLIWLRGAMRALLTRVPREARTQAETDAARILAAVEQHATRARAGRGLALYAAPGLWTRHVLPVPIQNRVAYGTPSVLPLLDALDAYEAYGILIVDHERARMLVAYLGETTVVEDDALELHRETWRFKAGRPPTLSRLVGVGAGRGAHAEPFEARIAHQQQGFWAGVAGATDRLMRDRRIGHLVISGSVEAAAEVRRSLPESRAQQVVGFVPLPAAGADLREIQERTLPVVQAARARRDADLVAALLDRAAHRSAVLGKAATLAALDAGRAMTVVVDRAAGETREAVLIAARRTGASVVSVGAPAAAALAAAGGIGALLRYRVGDGGTPAA
jgi:hypothetical protein